MDTPDHLNLLAQRAMDLVLNLVLTAAIFIYSGGGHAMPLTFDREVLELLHLMNKAKGVVVQEKRSIEAKQEYLDFALGSAITFSTSFDNVLPKDHPNKGWYVNEFKEIQTKVGFPSHG
jgi:hypothetical protein